MYAEISQEQIIAYPCNPFQDHPTTSFPLDWPGGWVNGREYAKVINVFPPSHDYQHDVQEQLPEFVNGHWQQSWIVVEATPEKIQQRNANQELMQREQRNQKLLASDWTQLNNTPLGPELVAQWAEYRQQLRDITNQPSWPWDITCPVPPAG